VTGVDFAPRAIKLARRKLIEAGVQAELLVGDATKLEGIDGSFDLGFDLGCFHTIPQNRRNQYLEQLHRILAPHGFWLLYGFLRSDAPHAEPGLGEAEISRIASRLTLLSRRDGLDEHGERSSAWFLFQKEKHV
jgi:ubiquinone/menaquinone biosynthesis C-methylase UbiE